MPDHPRFETIEEYGARFVDADYWRPWIETVCARHGMTCGRTRPGLPGTHPTFLVDDRFVVKFFSDRFDGAESQEIEWKVSERATNAGLPVSRLVAAGDLFLDGDDWRWPYIVFSLVPGASFGEVRDAVSPAGKEDLAIRLGGLVRRIHALRVDIPGSARFGEGAYRRFLTARRDANVDRHRRWGSLPGRLIDEIDSYLPSVDRLSGDLESRRFLHGDLTADHVLGFAEDGRWRTTGIIDFGDAREGDPAYEWIAVHLDLFRCDTRLLRAFLCGYGALPVDTRDFARRAMATMLLHEFDVLGPVFEHFPRARTAESLKELAGLIWDLDAPGLEET